jgi:peptidoglycan hydrolase CwlO-like protein
MSIQHIATELVERIRAAKGASETVVSTGDLRTFLQEGEKRLEALYTQIKGASREIDVLRDRVESQRDTINKLQTEVMQLKTKRK